MKPPFIKQCGVFHLPTCVNNVESLSLVAPLLLDDEGYYKSQGTPDCPGTKMISVCGNVKRPGVFEVPFGITIREIVYDLAGGMENEDYPLRLVQLGGASGRICSPAQLDTPYTYKGMRQADLTAIGSGAVLVVDERTSVIGFLRMTQEFFSHESCGQCTPLPGGQPPHLPAAGQGGRGYPHRPGHRHPQEICRHYVQRVPCAAWVRRPSPPC